jgi:plasmid stability protein
MLALQSLIAHEQQKASPMSTLTIRNIEPAIKDQLRLVAAAHGRSMEEEVRTILRNVMAQAATPTTGLGSRIHARFRAIGGVDLDLPERLDLPRAANLDAGGAA